MQAIRLPDFDTGQYVGSKFVMDGGDAELLVRIAEVGDVHLVFRRARWHQFTSLYSCDPETIRTAYFQVVEVDNSQRVRAILHADGARKAYRELHHYKIFLDETGCHEVVSESVSLQWPIAPN
jgi:hypothetical protein